VRTALLSLAMTGLVIIGGLFQFEKYQRESQDLQLQVGKLENEIKSKVEELDNSIALLKGQDQTILNHVKVTTWTSSEIEYLITLAATQLQTTYHTQSAIALLTSAKQKIDQLQDPRYASLQEALVQDLENLQRDSNTSPEKVWMKVSDLIAISASLPLKRLDFKKREGITATKENTNPSNQTWKAVFYSSIQQVKDLVKIRHHTQPVDPLLSESEQILIRENLRLLLEQMRAAVLARDQKIFERATEDLRQWLSQYYEATDQKVLDLQNTLGSLTHTNLTPTIASLLSAQQLEALR
jgi:uncharacterized protein HemX